MSIRHQITLVLKFPESTLIDASEGKRSVKMARVVACTLYLGSSTVHWRKCGAVYCTKTSK